MIEVDGKNIWINDEKVVYRINIRQVILHRSMKDNIDGVMTLLDSLKTIETAEMPVVCDPDVCFPNVLGS